MKNAMIKKLTGALLVIASLAALVWALWNHDRYTSWLWSDAETQEQPDDLTPAAEAQERAEELP